MAHPRSTIAVALPHWRWLLAASAAVLPLAGCAEGTEGEQANGKAGAACDRECLIGAMDDYLAAMVAHDPAAAPLADGVRFVENLERLQPGDGLWSTITAGPTGFAIPVPDEQQQQIGWLGVVERDGAPLMLAIRLKLDGSLITEAEHIAAPPSDGSEARIARPRAPFLAEVPAGERLPHDELLRIGATYYDAVDDNDGSKSPLARDCVRHENGSVTAGEGADLIVPEEGRPAISSDCIEQLNSQAMAYIKSIDDRRMIAADPVTGLAMGFSHFRHPFDNLPYEVTLSDGTKAERNAENMAYDPFDMPAAHIFKIGPEGQIHEIEAIGFVAPLNSATGWEK